MDVKQRLLAIKITSLLTLMAYGAVAHAEIVAGDDYLVATPGQTVVVEVLANDFNNDHHGDIALTVFGIALISGQAELALQPDNTVLVTPAADFEGRVEFSYYARNLIGHNATAIAVVDYSPPKTALSPDVIAAMSSTFAVLNQLSAQAAQNHQRVVSQVLNMGDQASGNLVYRKQAPLGAAAGDGLLPVGGVFVSVDATRLNTKTPSASKTNLQSLTAGADINFGRQWVVGAAFGASTAEIKSPQNNVAVVDFDELSLVGFAAYQYQRWQAEGQLGYSKTSAQSNGTNLNQQFEMDSNLSFALVKLEYLLNLGGFQLQPGIEARHQRGQRDAFSDATQTTRYSAQNTNDTFAALSLQASYQYNLEFGVISPQITLASEYSLTDDADPLWVSVDGEQFSLPTLTNRDDQSLLMDAGVGIVLRHGFSGFINYHQLFDQRAYGVKSLQLGGRWEF
ncbi:MAG: autotransporter domain-containing protein [Marinagarivorans sp.]|nr:autotransporter domain-containing protein [Marinagarivorans sp.]